MITRIVFKGIQPTFGQLLHAVWRRVARLLDQMMTRYLLLRNGNGGLDFPDLFRGFVSSYVCPEAQHSIMRSRVRRTSPLHVDFCLDPSLDPGGEFC